MTTLREEVERLAADYRSQARLDRPNEPVPLQAPLGVAQLLEAALLLPDQEQPEWEFIPDTEEGE